MIPNWPAGVGHIALETVDSTNAEARRVVSGLTAATWITSEEQTGGRGRRGRDWHSPKGNFYGTYVLPLAVPPAEAALRSFVVSLALREAMIGATSQSDIFALKWPNDVLGSGKKLAGILLETEGTHLMIGIGVNLMESPVASQVETTATPPASLWDVTNKPITPLNFLMHLAPAMVKWERVMATQGFASIRAEWLSHATRLGEEITARLTNTQKTGIFETVDEQGAIVLNAPDGRHYIAAADIFFS